MKFRILLILIAGLTACSNSSPAVNSNSPAPTAANVNAAAATKSAEHEHHAPHGGTLVVLGEEFAHLELVLDKLSGKLSASALDSEAENAIKIVQTEIEIKIEKPRTAVIKLAAIENSLTGEKRGDTSEFAGASDALKNLADFDGVIRTIFIKGRQFNNVSFNYPNGNEDKH